MRSAIPEVGTILEIYHLACPASPDYFGSNPVDILETCFTGTKNMLDMAVTNNAKILIASTSGKCEPEYISYTLFTVCTTHLVVC